MRIKRFKKWSMGVMEYWRQESEGNELWDVGGKRVGMRGKEKMLDLTIMPGE
jgi:hypothetical protein